MKNIFCNRTFAHKIQNLCIGVVKTHINNFYSFLIRYHTTITPIALFYTIRIHTCGPGSPVGLPTDYGLDGPGSNPGRDEIFRPSRRALGPPSLL